MPRDRRRLYTPRYAAAPFARLVDLVGALARPLAAGAGVCGAPDVRRAALAPATGR